MGRLPPRKSQTLTEAELRLMNVLWQKGSATVQQVLDGLPPKPALAYNSVLTTIRILENKGYVKHVKDGRAHVYMPLVGRREATRFEIRHLVSRFFHGEKHIRRYPELCLAALGWIGWFMNGGNLLSTAPD